MKSTHKDSLTIFLLFILLNVIIFHNVLLQYPEILSGDKIVFQEELIPYFDLSTQYWDNIFSTYDYLIDRPEIRSEYYFPTSWVRYYLFLPLMLVLLNAVAGVLMWYSVNILFTKFCCKNLNLMDNLCIFFATLPPYLLLMYSKVTHFYSLIFGFAMFSLAISLYIANMKQNNLRYLFFMWILLFFNPAIHYIFLFFPIAAVITIFFMAFFPKYGIIKQYLLLSLFVLVPKYIIFNILLDIGDVQQSIPVSYTSVSASSVYPILTNLVLESTAPINVILYNAGYIHHTPNNFLILFILLLPIPLMITKISKNENIIATINLLLFLIGLAFSMGPKFILSYYRYIFDLIELPFIGKILFFYLQVIRFPHRWQFIEYYAMMFLLSLVFITAFYKVTTFLTSHKIPSQSTKFFSLFLIFILISTPFVVNNRYNDTLFSGNFNFFLEPYTIPQDIKNIKYTLEKDKNVDGRLLILPPGTGGLRLKELNDANNIPYGYNDALYIFYFNVPSIEVGYISPQKERMLGFLIWYSVMELDDELFYKLLIDNNVSKIFIHEDFYNNKNLYFQTQKYLKNLNGIVEKLENKRKVKIEYSSNKYSLVYLIDSTNETNEINNSKPLFIDDNLNTAVESYKHRDIPFANLIGVQPDDIIAIISSKHNVTSSEVFLYEIPYSSSQGITPSYSIMSCSYNAIKWHFLSKKLIAGTYGAVNSNYILLKGKSNMTYDLPHQKFNKTSIYVRSAGSLHVNIFDSKGIKLCDSTINSDHIQNVFVCSVNETPSTIELTNLKGLSVIDSIILASNEVEN